mmetsp:Transcript_3119/g.5486  ORF Transcript_3119/g.5486 Transcript_3119/m.5486 type:complete len:445 (-) Transcript_3119:1091-2425(-)|eukprot:CAMPEP_0182444460 /NCGR_PEP_ID=MMETSP1172-20130603/2905_1 /TAXON_ID=708627 /ORGANISM="Timspurckia oligopyrenoides, Strain CCMP3278" /LENGTH=444 /DNA_ID=CAMNT_0024640017 /DNA_START=58 /DNA_END=1392 /DNA_ORIENTATION=-
METEWNWKRWAMVGGAVVGTTAVVSLGVAAWKNRNEAMNPGSIGDGIESMDRTQQVLMRELASYVEDLSQEKPVDSRSELAVLRKLQRLGDNIHSMHSATRVLVAQYCLHMYQYRIRAAAQALSATESADVPKETRETELETYRKAESSLKSTYLESAWDVLSKLNAEPPKELYEGDDMISKLYSTQLDIAFMLQDVQKIHEWYEKAYASLSRRLDKADSREILMALLAAASCGRVDQVASLGERLTGNELDGIHAGALEDPGRVDFSSIYTLALQLNAGGASVKQTWPQIGKELAWKAYTVKKARFQAQNPAAVDAAILRPQVKAGKYTDYAAPEGSHFVRSGSVIHFVNPGPVPLPMSGFGSDDDSLLFGYFDIVQGKEAIRVTNFLTLKRDAASKIGRWIGKELCSMIAIAGPRAGSRLSTVLLDAELYLIEDPSASYKCL